MRIRVQDRDPVAELTGGEREHPPELAAAQDPDRRRRQDGGGPEAEGLVDAEDPGRLRVRVAETVDAAPAGDRRLQLRVLTRQLWIVAQSVAEGDVPTGVAAGGLNVEVDPELVAVQRHRAHEHRARRRPRVRPGLRLESEPGQHLHDPGDFGGLHLDGQVHDPLARQAGNRGAPDVLHGKVRSLTPDHRADRRGDFDRPWIPCRDMRHAALVRQDRKVGAIARRIGHGVEV